MKKTNQKEALKIWLGVLLLPFVIGAGAVGKRLPNLSKKAITICVAAVMVLSLLPIFTFAEETDEARWVVQTGTDLPDTFTDSGTLEEAMAVANGTEDGAYTYIQLCRDVTVDNYTAVELDCQQYAVLDLGGYTLAATSDGYTACAVENYGTLLVRNGTATASGPSARAIYSYGCTILESGTFTATRTSNSSYPEGSGYGVFVGMGQFYLGDVTKIEGTDADIFLANDEVLVANDGAATPTYYNGNTLKIATFEPPLPYNDFNPRPYVYHDEILVSGLNSTNKDKFVLVDYDAEFFQTQYDEDNSWLTMEGKPMSLSWLDEDGTVLTGSDYPASVPFTGELSLPAATKTGKEFVGWMYRQADSDFWSSDYQPEGSSGTVTFPMECKAVYLYDLTPVTDDTGTYIPIRTAEDLMALSAIINSGYNSDVYNDNSVTYRLMNDLDMSQVCGKDIGSFLPIGNCYPPSVQTLTATERPFPTFM